MRKIILLLGAIFFIVTLTGCKTPCPSVLDNITGSSFEVKGLNITIPRATPVPITLGQFNFGPAEAQKISDSILAIDSYKTAQCQLIEQLKDLKPPPTNEIATIATTIATANQKILDIANGLYNAPSKEAALQNAVTAVQSLAQPAQPAPPGNPGQPAPPGGSGGNQTSYFPPRDWYRNTDDRLDALTRLITDFKNGSGKSGSSDKTEENIPHSNTLTLTGFAVGKSNLSDSMKSRIASFFKKVYESYPSSGLLNVALIGYADTSGAYTKNLALGLSRARAVAEYLTQIDLLKPSRMRFIASGGVSDDFSEGRQVEIHVLSFPI